eukprot:TRINITY_DN19876_c0_g3_i1.p1 TRINITY_DN19876_c0_g3~~TRINITY_DN19876_c0_g3_i1.p1  ORF type:complete len:718 (-),score=157.20 TRINITY_DN19876_c0_g3_i1:471-2624(-)
MGKKRKAAPTGATPEEEVDFYIAGSREQFERNSMGSAVFQAEEALRLSREKLGWHLKTGHALVHLGFLLISQGKCGKARGLCEQAKDLADQLREPGLGTRAMELMAECALQDKNTTKKSVKFKNAQQFMMIADDLRAEQARDKERKQRDKMESEIKKGKHDTPKRVRTEQVEAPGTPEEINMNAVPDAARVPTNLKEYQDVDASSGWMRHETRSSWLWHTASEVFYNTETTDYYRLENGQAVLVQKEQAQPDQQQQQQQQSAAPQAAEQQSVQPTPDVTANHHVIRSGRQQGTVKYFVQAKRYGFIVPDTPGGDVYLKPKPSSTLEFSPGTRVEFSMGTVDGRAAAVDVVVVTVAGVQEQVRLSDSNISNDGEDPVVVQTPVKEKSRSDREGLYQEMGSANKWDSQLKSGDATLRGRQLHNEDRVTSRGDGRLGKLGSLFALFDGHGGHGCAEYCRLHMASTVYKAYRDAPAVAGPSNLKPGAQVFKGFQLAGTMDSDGNDGPVGPPKADSQVEDAFFEAIREMELSFHEEAQAQELRCGTTAVQCLVHGKDTDSLRLTVANVGDSRIVLCRGGRAVRLSEDHKPNRKDEKIRIEQAGGTALQVAGTWRVTQGKGWGTQRFNIPETQLLLACSRTIGDYEMKEGDDLLSGPIICTPEVNTQPIEAEDFFVVLGSDGVWDHMTEQEVVDIGMSNFGNPQQSAQQICQASFDNEYCGRP